MAELKTKKNPASVTDFLSTVQNEKRKQDSIIVLELMKKITKTEATMWGPSIVGFGDFYYTTSDGKKHSWFLTGLSPRKQSLTLYLMTGLDHYEEILSRLGKHKTGKSCLYINKLEDIRLDVLAELITASVKFLNSRK